MQTEELVALPDGAISEVTLEGSRRTWWRQFRRQPVGIASAVVLCLMVAIALAAPLISSYLTHEGPSDQNLLTAFQGPSGGHWLGTDDLGRDTLTRLVWGARVSFEVAFLAVALNLIWGGSIGLIAGYYGGVVDTLITRIIDMVLSIPAIFLLLLIATLLPLRIGPIVLRHNAITIAVVIALTAWGSIARLARAETLSVRSKTFVEAALAVGASDQRIMRRHILPNITPTLLVAASIGIPQVILLEAAIDFIGVGVQPPTASWGNMLLNAQSLFYRAPMLAVYPGLCIMLAVLSATLLGNALRDALDPRLRR